jgi:hypothetical protein
VVGTATGPHHAMPVVFVEAWLFDRTTTW